MPTPNLRLTHRARWLIAGGYVLCWVIGLLVESPSIIPGASSTEIELAFAGSAAALTFGIFVHGLAAAFLVALSWTLSIGIPSRLVWSLACTAAALSLAQLSGEVILVFAPEGIDAAVVWESITRVDGAKMLVLAGLAAAVLHVHPRGRRLLMFVSVATMLALVASGLGYLLLAPPLMLAASVSLPLLLIWVLTATAARTIKREEQR